MNNLDDLKVATEIIQVDVTFTVHIKSFEKFIRLQVSFFWVVSVEDFHSRQELLTVH